MHSMWYSFIKLMEVVKEVLQVSYRKLCATLNLAYSTFMRWKGRTHQGEPILKRPGPKKEKPLELKGLMEEIRELSHRRKRSLGTGLLFEDYKDLVSRRTFQELVRRTRQEVKRDKKSRMRRIKWKQAGLVSSLDDTYYGRDEENKKLYLHSVRDLSSRYQFIPLAGEFAKGEEVAKNLRALFKRYGAPLIVKKDNGGNLNHPAVNTVLSEYGVIPLNSPVRYPPYNGAIEKSQHEVKSEIDKRKEMKGSLPRTHFPMYAEAAANDLNHKPRRSLNGQCACQVFFSKKGGVKFSKRKRREIFEWIKKLSCAIMVGLGKSTKRASQAAWRMAVETWLQRNGFIEVSINGKVLPIFTGDLSH